MQREIGRLKRFLGRVYRDVRRKLVSRPDLADRFAEPLALIERLLAQQRTDKHKLYALHAPEVECLSKGKIGKRYEFGVKVALATTNREGLVVAMQALPGNPHDGHTLAPTLIQVERLTGTSPVRCFVDRGYRGHGVRATTTVVMAGQRRGLTATLRRELRRRSAIEATIGHMKAYGRLDRNYLKGTAGDAINAILCAAGHNLRLILAHLAKLLRALLRLLAALDPKHAAALELAQIRLLQGRLARLESVPPGRRTRRQDSNVLCVPSASMATSTAPAGQFHDGGDRVDVLEVDRVVSPELRRISSRAGMLSTTMIVVAPMSRPPAVAQSPIGSCANTATVSPIRTPPLSAPQKPLDMMSGHIRTCSSLSWCGTGIRFAMASGISTYSAWQPSMVLPNFQPPIGYSRAPCWAHPGSRNRTERRYCSPRA
jgi:IS5 family transposase